MGMTAAQRIRLIMSTLSALAAISSVVVMSTKEAKCQCTGEWCRVPDTNTQTIQTELNTLSSIRDPVFKRPITKESMANILEQIANKKVPGGDFYVSSLKIGSTAFSASDTGMTLNKLKASKSMSQSTSNPPKTLVIGSLFAQSGSPNIVIGNNNVQLDVSADINAATVTAAMAASPNRVFIKTDNFKTRRHSTITGSDRYMDSTATTAGTTADVPIPSNNEYLVMEVSEGTFGGKAFSALSILPQTSRSLSDYHNYGPYAPMDNWTGTYQNMKALSPAQLNAPIVHYKPSLPATYNTGQIGMVHMYGGYTNANMLQDEPGMQWSAKEAASPGRLPMCLVAMA